MLSQNKIIGSIFLVLFLVMLVAGYRSSDPSVVANVAQHPITVAEFKARMIKRSGGMTQYYESDQNKQTLLNEMIEHKVQLIAAKQAGYENDPEVITALERIMIAKLRAEKLKKVLQEVTVGQGEIEDYYQENISNYTTPARVRIAIIQLKLSALASKEKQAAVKAKAEEIIKLAQTLPATVKGFGSLAAQYSESQASRYAGGDIGWLVPGKEYSNLDKALLQSINTLKNKNELAPLVKAKDGFYLVKLIDKKPLEQQPLTLVEQNIRQTLHKQKSKTAEAGWLQSLKNRVTPIITDQVVLKSVEPPPATRQPRDEQRPPDLPKG